MVAGNIVRRSPGRTLLIFRIAGEYCALPVSAVREIVPMAALARAPGQPSLIEGFLNLRGTAVPVVRPHRLLDVPGTEPGLYTPLIVLKGEASPTALLADQVVEVAEVPEDSLLAVADTESFNGCAEQQGTWNGRTIHVLAPSRLLLEKERRSLAEFQARAQQYLDELEAAPE